jgi:putative ubiquitin-RnfH superfamily antitoxin RatB of RatAB toxin-antitoxin module
MPLSIERKRYTEMGVNKITVEVAYALKDKQLILAFEAPEGQTVEEAIHASGILKRFGSIDLKKNKVGIFGKSAKLDQALQERDRIEIYRPITCDPKEVRRQRAKKKK